MKKQIGEQAEDSDQLKQEAELLRKEVQRLELEVDILRGTAELIKKDPCVDPTLLNNAEKTMLIDALKGKHRLDNLLKALEMPRSSYYYESGTAANEHIRSASRQQEETQVYVLCR